MTTTVFGTPPLSIGHDGGPHSQIGLTLSVSFSTSKPLTTATLKEVLTQIGSALSGLGTAPSQSSGRKRSSTSDQSRYIFQNGEVVRLRKPLTRPWQEVKKRLKKKARKRT